MKRHKLLTIFVLSVCSCAAMAQEALMDILNERYVKLQDGTDVRLYAKVGDATTWYYLPAGFRLATRPDGVPHFLFLKYVTEQRESQGGASGAIFSAMFQYGLTNAQLDELKGKVNATPHRMIYIKKVGRIGGGGEEEEGQVVRGPAVIPFFQGGVKILPAPITTEGPGSFQVVSAVLSEKTLTRSLVCSGRAPTFPGEKMAIAANLGPIGAQLFVAPLEKRMASSDLKCEINYNYYVKSPAVDATLTVDMSKFDERTETINKHFRKLFKTERTYFLGIKVGQKDVPAGETYQELYQDMQVLRDMGVISCVIDTKVDSELATKITEGFLQMFITLMTQPMNQDSKNDSKENDEEAGKKVPDVDKGLDYSQVGSTRYTLKQKLVSRVYKFSASVPIKKQGKMTADLLDMYDAVKSNPLCVGSVLLNDPFFTHRDIKVVLDLDAKDIFEETINYATINIRKRRASGRDFLDSVTIDSKYLRENGAVASLTYARGEEQNPDSFEYQIQWSLRGGVVYPANPSWQVGQFQGVTVAPPVRPTTIDFQWDNEAMKAKDIVRVIAQVNYWQFGKEQTSSIQPVGDQNTRTFKFFRDDGRPEYAYRLVYFHKVKGRLAGEWQRDSSGYIYASIPEDIGTNDDFLTRAKNIADGVVEKVLERLGKAAAGIGGQR